MRIALRFVVEMTPDEVQTWRDEYGVEDVREDVRQYVLTALQTVPLLGDVRHA